MYLGIVSLYFRLQQICHSLDNICHPKLNILRPAKHHTNTENLAEQDIQDKDACYVGKLVKYHLKDGGATFDV